MVDEMEESISNSTLSLVSSGRQILNVCHWFVTCIENLIFKSSYFIFSDHNPSTARSPKFSTQGTDGPGSCACSPPGDALKRNIAAGTDTGHHPGS